ncbi:MAG: 2,3,4,5-tetrahydropyridine-2,6-dicarboxylate N-succinyltransferase [Pseudomonadota bacterium]|nr:2,3,4,5-tetrahydropyridine-2,6-dicarboxylate N-succinyltransferase [Pseudomonadota bacterium]
MGKNMELQTIIDRAWEERQNLNTATRGEIRGVVEHTLDLLDEGKLRVAEKTGGQWQVHQWIKKAVLLSFRLSPMELLAHGPYVASQWDDMSQYSYWYDKVPSKFQRWNEERFQQAGFRAVPGCFVRRSAYIGKDVVLMPSFVNVGAHVGDGTMIDTWSTVGSCAQIGKHCHISGGVGIGGVLEPLQANPVIIEDNCFIGARSEVAEGVIVEEGSVISMGVFLGASTKIIDRASGEVMYGKVPAYSVVVPGTLPGKTPDSPSLYCAVIVKRVDEKTRAKTSINELLRA